MSLVNTTLNTGHCLNSTYSLLLLLWSAISFYYFTHANPYEYKLSDRITFVRLGIASFTRLRNFRPEHAPGAFRVWRNLWNIRVLILGMVENNICDIIDQDARANSNYHAITYLSDVIVHKENILWGCFWICVCNDLYHRFYWSVPQIFMELNIPWFNHITFKHTWLDHTTFNNSSISTAGLKDHLVAAECITLQMAWK